MDVLSDDALIAARSRLNPAAGMMLSALWAADAGQLVLVIHHLVVDAVSWRILLEDLNTAWFQHRSGQPTTLPATGTSYARWASLLTEYAHRPTSSTRPTRGSSWRPHRLCCPRCGPSSTRSPPPGTCRRGWIPTPPGCCWPRRPRRFMPGCTSSC
ncbi:condensation domain protein [Mycobacterium xenopi 4042]|uniref:Condensation domain protein n=1 Tax=Mycobacterium xenopi 4042 TaxID=1299334 RepID=X8AQW8_MYCXE|nr:condensation domain protein [Mycobacterium xenopi 4042]